MVFTGGTRSFAPASGLAHHSKLVTQAPPFSFWAVPRTIRWVNQGFGFGGAGTSFRHCHCSVLRRTRTSVSATAWSFVRRTMDPVERERARTTASGSSFEPRVHTDIHGCCAFVVVSLTSSVFACVHPWLQSHDGCAAVCTSFRLRRFSTHALASFRAVSRIPFVATSINGAAMHVDRLASKAS